MQKLAVIIIVLMAFILMAIKIAAMLRGSADDKCKDSACADCPLKSECNKQPNKR